MNFLTSAKAKFIVLQTILAAGLVGLYIQGLLLKPFEGEALVFSTAVIFAAMWALLKIWQEDFASAEWFSEKLIRVGIIGLQVGMLSAMAAMAERLVMGGEVMQVTGFFLASMAAGLYVSVIALASNLWLEFNLYVLGE